MYLVRVAKLLLAMAGTLLLAACLPIPHHVALSPAIDGTVHRNGKPVAGARLYVENSSEECTFQDAPLATSDADGAFHIPLRQRLVYFTAMDPAPGPAWRLCIADGEQRYAGWYEESLLHYDGIALDCDLESPPRTWEGRGMYNIRVAAGGVCRSHTDEVRGKLVPVPASGSR